MVILWGQEKVTTSRRSEIHDRSGKCLWPLPLGMLQGRGYNHSINVDRVPIINTSFVTLVNKTNKNPSLKEPTHSREEKNKGEEKIKEKVVKYIVLDRDRE